jgi:hypothetical protein
LSYEADKLDLEQRMTELERKRAERGQWVREPDFVADNEEETSMTMTFEQMQE